MMGFVTPEFKAAVHIFVVDRGRNPIEVEVFIDTGFNGDLSLSPTLVEQAQFKMMDEVAVQLADGSSVSLPIFAGTILWNAHPRQATIIATNGDPVLGMRLLEGSELRIEVKSGGAVSIEPLH